MIIIVLLLVIALALALFLRPSLPWQTGGASASSGLQLHVYRTDSLGQQLELLKTTVHDAVIDNDWGNGEVLNTGLNDNVLLEFTGFVTVPVTGNWQFRTQSDDGVQLK